MLWPGLLTFLCKLGARRQGGFHFDTPQFVQNFQHLTGSTQPRVCSHDTIAYLCKKMVPGPLAALLATMAQRLIRMKCLESWRLFHRWYLLAFDGTGVLAYDKRHCPYCLTAKFDGVTKYYHHVLTANLVTSSGLSLAVDFEFIDNRDLDPSLRDKSPDEQKQDCERKAFYRLAPRVKELFPQLPVCLLSDSLYANQRVFDICKDYHWAFIMTLKEGSLPSVYAEFETLKRLSTPKPHEVNYEGVRQLHSWVNDIAYHHHTLHVFECLQPDQEKGSRFCWVTSFRVTEENCSELSNQGGRQRWKVENQGFNIQKNGGYGLEHAYSLDPLAMVNFYALLQIAHVLAQLLETGSLLGRAAIAGLGGLRNVARRLLESLRCHPTSPEAFEQLFVTPFQIRLNSS